MELHRGRLFDHVHLKVRNLEASKRFYRAVLEALGVPMGEERPDAFWADELRPTAVPLPTPVETEAPPQTAA